MQLDLCCNFDTIAVIMIFCTVVLSVIQGVALNTGVLPLAKGRVLHVVCRFHVAAIAELRLDRRHKQIV
jgi:hypothetical protein